MYELVKEDWGAPENVVGEEDHWEQPITAREESLTGMCGAAIRSHNWDPKPPIWGRRGVG